MSDPEGSSSSTAPRSGKSSIVAAIQESIPGTWMNLGVDVARAMTPIALQPGVGLRPGAPDHAAARHVARLYAALYDSIAAHSRHGLDVAVDAGHHDRTILSDASARFSGLPVLFVGIGCPIDVTMDRRRASAPGLYTTAAVSEAIPAPILGWQEQVHGGWRYDLEIDTSVVTPTQAAAQISELLDSGAPLTAFMGLADVRM